MLCFLCPALSKFSEAIIEYCANIDKAPDKSITKDRFSQEIGSAFDVLFSTWLQSKEAKVRCSGNQINASVQKDHYYWVQDYFHPMLFSPCHTCKLFCSLLISTRHDFVMFKYDLYRGVGYDFYPTSCVFSIPKPWRWDRKHSTSWIKIISNPKAWEILFITL